ncbi:hypothetical protein LFL96_09390 [Paraburkholderia sp. D15]|uniref:hypothetical protein n=1 Tax=Paraburkholderia sp. D15 TaxID=2880218 RepID=UPI00247ABB9E|nr:hypothetical protein [Paraburkholderia sp. D15]WGS51687.1 hypothetical protein LFL96_09390 [Paraburkholderia sp. D15]
MKAIAIQSLSAVLIASALAGCMVPAQNRATASSNTSLTTADWDKVTDSDRASVRAGRMPKEVISYDLQIGKMIPEGQQLIAAHDQVKGPIWAKKMNALIEARNKAMEKFNASAMARNNAIANATGSALGNSKPDPCLSPMGKNICGGSTAQQGDRANYTVGPGGIGATIGHYTVVPGGIGMGGF